MSKKNKNIPHVLLIVENTINQQGKDKYVKGKSSKVIPRFLTSIVSDYPHGFLTSSDDVYGLNSGYAAKSEVRHMSMGAGRFLLHDADKISLAIKDKSFYQNEALVNAVYAANENHGDVHILGLLSDGGIHSRYEHIQAMCHSAVVHGAKNVYVHCILDGRDVAEKSADIYINHLQKNIDALNSHYGKNVQIASLIGRHFAMDKDQNWDKIQVAYELLTKGKSERKATRADGALQAGYRARETDEFISATTVIAHGDIPHTIKNDDAVIFMNFRADRACQLSQAFVLPDHEFTGFYRGKKPKLSAFVMLSEYSTQLMESPLTSLAYQTTRLKNTLGGYLQKNKKIQLRMAQQKKYEHVTYFFNGAREYAYRDEDRVIVADIGQSELVDTKKTEKLSITETNHGLLTKNLIEAIESGKYDFILVSYSSENGDESLDNATDSKQQKSLQKSISQVIKTVEKMDGEMLIVTDPVKVDSSIQTEQNQNPPGIVTAHALVVYVGSKNLKVNASTKLCDIAPTILYLMGLDKPKDMTGSNCLIEYI